MISARLIASLAALVLPTSAATLISQTSMVSSAVADNDDIGLVDIQTISADPAATVTDISVELGFSGGWNGDLYVYLSHDTGFSVLLNRAGRTAANPDGAASSGMNITLSDGAATDVHTGLPSSGVDVTGTFQPDGRETDPLSVVDTDPRTALLNSFIGLQASGDWTLFVADQAAGATSTLESWTLNLTVQSPIPEPRGLFLLGLGLAGLFLRRSRA